MRINQLNNNIGNVVNDMPILPTRMLTIDEVAEVLNLTVDTVRRLVRNGVIPAVKIGTASNSPLRVNPADLANLIGRSAHHPASNIT